MYKYIALFVGLLIIDAWLVWRPFDSRFIAYQSGSRHSQPAGQIVQGFHLTQDIPGKLYHPALPRRHITHWHRSRARLYRRNPNCFALKFATYIRANTGHITVSWRQGTAKQQWQVNAAHLRDNAFVDFCPEAGLDVAEPFELAVDGVDSIAGHAATLWLAKSSLSAAQVNGKSPGGRGVVLQLTRDRRVVPRQILGLDNGAFALACLCSLAIGILSLAAIRRRRGLQPKQNGAA